MKEAIANSMMFVGYSTAGIIFLIILRKSWIYFFHTSSIDLESTPFARKEIGRTLMISGQVILALFVLYLVGDDLYCLFFHWDDTFYSPGYETKDTVFSQILQESATTNALLFASRSMIINTIRAATAVIVSAIIFLALCIHIKK